jgi:hypothetical protein
MRSEDAETFCTALGNEPKARVPSIEAEEGKHGAERTTIERIDEMARF